MGSSDIIKVDTEQLRAMASGYAIRSNSVDVVKNNNAGTIQSIIYRMPAYDGRLQQAAKGDMLDFSKRADEFSNWFKEDSASLIKTAEAFEVIDGQTIQVFQDADEITRASLIDAGKNLGLSAKITTKTITNPDGSITTITCVRTINEDGTVTTTTTIKTVLVLDAKTAKDWTTAQKVGEAILIGGSFLIVGYEVAAFATELELGFRAAQALSAGIKIIKIGATVGGILTPERGWKEGDAVTKTSTIVTTEPLDTPDTPIPETPILGPDITTTTVVTDSSGTVLSEDTTGIGPTGILK